MLVYFHIATFLLASVFISSVDSQGAVQEYVIRRDFFVGLKAGEFSVYDKSEKQVYYRIESKYGVMQNVEILAYPSKQVVGRLQAKINLLLYKAEFSILDSQSNKWINGLIIQNFQWLGGSVSIDWNGQRITMETEAVSLTSKFRDTNGELLAQFRIRLGSMFWTNKYDMKIFSTKFPQELYLLLLAARDHIVRRTSKG
jgi:hypothetical protein